VQLDRLQAVLRPRTSFEAIDLGFAMVRRWWKPVWVAWFAAVLPWFAVVWVLLRGTPWIALLLLWWLKPLYDRVPLLVLSRALFGDTPDQKAVLRALPGLWIRHLFLALVLYRFDPMRSFYLPVLQLEGIDSRLRGRRRTALTRTMGAAATWLTVVCLCLELAIDLGVFGLVMSMLPDTPDYDILILGEHIWDGTAPAWLMSLLPLIVLVGHSAVEPLYVGAGFALYLNRRTRLEGWDVELIFRGLAERLQRDAAGAARAAVVMLVAAMLAGASLLAPREAFAQAGGEPDMTYDPLPIDGLGSGEPAADPPGVPPVVAPDGTRPSVALESSCPDVAEAVRRVLDRPEFPHPEKRMVWRPRERRERDDDDGRDFRLPSFLEPLGQLLATGLEGLMWVLIAVAVAGLVIVIVSRLKDARPAGRRKREPLPGPTVGREEETQPLPPDVPGEALRLFEKGLLDRALGLLYRGALAELVESKGLAIEDGATEGECLRAVRREAPEPLAGTFARLTGAWVEVAFAHRAIDGDRFRLLCDDWRAHFGGAR